MRKPDMSLALHGLIAACSVALAVCAWQRPQWGQPEDGAPTILSISIENLSRIDWRDGDMTVSVARDTTRPRKAARFWVSTHDKSDKAQTWPGTQAAQTLYERVAPLRAVRDLGKLSPEQAQAFGLSDSHKALTLWQGDTAHVYKLGNTTFGSGDTYAEDGRGRAFLLGAASIASLQHGAVSLLDRSAVGLGEDDFDRVVVRQGQRQRELLHRHKPAGETGTFFADPAEPDRALDKASDVFDQVLRMRVMDLQDKDPSGAAAGELTFFRDNAQVGKLSLWAGHDGLAQGTSSYHKQPLALFTQGVQGVLQGMEGLFEAPGKP